VVIYLAKQKREAGALFAGDSGGSVVNYAQYNDNTAKEGKPSNQESSYSGGSVINYAQYNDTTQEGRPSNQELSVQSNS